MQKFSTAKVQQKNKLNKLIHKIMKNLTNKMKFTTTLVSVQTLVRTKEEIKELIISLVETQDKYIIYYQIEEENKYELCCTCHKHTAFKIFRNIFLNDIEQFIKQNELKCYF